MSPSSSSFTRRPAGSGRPAAARHPGPFPEALPASRRLAAGWRITVSAVLLGLVGCATTPTPNARLESARQSWAAANADSGVASTAGRALASAGDALQRADKAWRAGAATDEVDHLAYVAGARTQAALEAAKLAGAERQIAGADDERERLVLEQRTREADQARQQAQAAGQALADANRQADQSRGEAERLARQLEGLQAHSTESSLVVTLQGVLFDVGETALRPGAERAMDQLAEAMQASQGQRVTVAGFTDSIGDASSNRVLSVRRAQAVKDALVARGVSPDRVDTVGFGEEFPIASNENESGRQMNRRVEIAFEGTGETAPMPAG